MVDAKICSNCKRNWSVCRVDNQSGVPRLAEAGIEPSVGSVGDSDDNALAKTINGLYKAEIIHRRGPRRSFDTVEYATLEWVDWFHTCRLLGPKENFPPAEAETNFYAALDAGTMAAQVTSTSLRQTGGSSMRVLAWVGTGFGAQISDHLIST